MSASACYHSDDGIMTQVRNCHGNLIALQSEYSKSLERVIAGCSGPSSLSHVVNCTQHQVEWLARETQDTQNFLELMKLTEALENEKLKLLNERQDLVEENQTLKEEVERLRKKVMLCEENIVQLECDKQHLEFTNQLHAKEKEGMNDLASEFCSNDGGDFDGINGLNFPLPCRKMDASPTIRSIHGRSAEHGFRARGRAAGLLRESEERSPLIKCGANKHGFGNYTMTMGDAIDGDELDELTDKLSWYESIMRQLQQIFCTELDDPDVTYHEESSKIVERAKRMVEYREMVRDYEKTIDELRKKNDKLRRERQGWLNRSETMQRSQRDRILSDSTPKIYNQLPVSSSSTDTLKRKNSR